MKISRVDTLKQSFIFSCLSEDELTELANIATEHSFTSSKYVFWDGDAPEWFYIIAEGKVKVVKHSSSGKEFIIAFFGPGEMFGEVAVFENRPYPVSAQAITETSVIGIRRDNFLSFLINHPRATMRIMSVLAGRLRDAQNRLRDIAGERVEQRLASMLVMLSAKLGPTLPFTREEIANMTGTTTETAIRIMSRLKDRKIISTARGETVILNEKKLRLLSEGPPLI
jgi:CRP/FNR family transcriptional regulator